MPGTMLGVGEAMGRVDKTPPILVEETANKKKKNHINRCKIITKVNAMKKTHGDYHRVAVH